MNINSVKVKHFVKNNSLLLKIILSYLIIGIILISTFSSILINKIYNNSVDDVNDVSTKMLAQSFNSADILLDNVYKYIYRLYNNEPIVFNALCGKNFSQIELGEINKKLTETASSNPLIYSVYIYNAQADLVFSNLGPSMEINEFYDQQAITYIKNYNPAVTDRFLPRKGEFELLDKNISKNLISVVYADKKSPESAIIVNIDQQILHEMIGDKEETQIQSFIVNNRGIVISHAKDDMINKDINEEEYIKRIFSSGSKSGYFTTEVNDRPVLVTYIKADKLGWSFIGIGEYSQLLSKVNTLKRSILLITLFFIVGGVFIGAVFTRNIYSPIYRLIKVMKTNNFKDNNIPPSTEYDFLKNTYYQLIEDVHELEKSVDNYIPANRKEVLRKIINGQFTRQDNYIEEIEKLSICLKSKYFIVIVLRLDSFKNLKEMFAMGDLNLFKYGIANISSELLRDKFKSEIIYDEADHVSIIVNIDNYSEETNIELNKILSLIQENITQYLKLTVTAAIGNVVKSIEEIRYSYQNALKTSDYRLTYGKATILKYDDIINIKRNNYEYPFDIEKKIMDSFKLGDLKKLNSNMDNFFEFVQAFNYSEILLSITQLTLITVGTAKNMIDVEKENLNLSYSDIQEKIIEYNTLDEIKAWLELLCSQVLERRSTVISDKRDETAKKIMKLAEENSYDANFCVDVLADMIGLSPNYVRSTFKDFTGESLSTYISNLRFKKAQELLSTSDYSAKDIAGMAGFSDSRYFYVAFKKFSGKTPDQFRKDFKTI